MKMFQSSAGPVMWMPFGLLLWIFLSPTIAMPGNQTEMDTSYDMMDPSMQPDSSYCQMLLQGPEPVSLNTVPWFCICTHCKGTVGPKGDQGIRGPPGSPGSPGRKGLTGFRGWPGFQGRPGLKGQKGDEGAKGAAGMMGYAGPKGQRGYKGEKGGQGLDGPAGEQGPQGEPGQCQVPCISVPGPVGPPGLPGIAGVRGLPGVAGVFGAKGQKGDTGIMGPIGQTGADGQKGEQGMEGTCDCQDGANGIDGSQGPPGPKGDKGDTGLQGVKGETGEKGDMGLEGMMGMPGPCSPAIQSAFSAALTTSNPLPKRPVPFDKIFFNLQGHYDPRGIYRAPVNGTYVFSFHVAVYHKVLKVGLFHNFKPVMKTTETSNLGSTSHQVVLHLSRGDGVWLLVKDETTNGMYAGSEISSTFSGFLLYPDTCEMPFFRDFLPELSGEYEWDETTP